MLKEEERNDKEKKNLEKTVAGTNAGERDRKQK